MSLEDQLQKSGLSSRILNTGGFFLRYGLVLVLGWIGAMKFTVYEAEGIKPLIETSPLMNWMYKFLSLQGTSSVIGVAELTAAALIAIKPLSAKLQQLAACLPSSLSSRR